MKRFVALLIGAALCGPAFAADLKPVFTKAPVPTGCTVTSCIGLFVGGSLVQSGGSLDVLGTGITGLAQNGFAMGGQGGYEFFSNKFYFAGLAHVESDMALNAAPGTSFTNRLDYGLCARVGYQLSGLLGASTSGASVTTPTLPQELLSSLMTPYVNVCEDKKHNQPAIVTGAGVEALLAADATGRSAWTLNVDYLHYNFNQGGAAGMSTAGTIGGIVTPLPAPVTQTTDNVIKASLNYHFGVR
jgi:hypothetical protein